MQMSSHQICLSINEMIFQRTVRVCVRALVCVSVRVRVVSMHTYRPCACVRVHIHFHQNI